MLTTLNLTDMKRKRLDHNKVKKLNQNQNKNKKNNHALKSNMKINKSNILKQEGVNLKHLKGKYCLYSFKNRIQEMIKVVFV